MALACHGHRVTSDSHALLEMSHTSEANDAFKHMDTPVPLKDYFSLEL